MKNCTSCGAPVKGSSKSARSTVMNTNMFNARNCFVIIGWVVMLIINSSYYAKRSELFVN